MRTITPSMPATQLNKAKNRMPTHPAAGSCILLLLFSISLSMASEWALAWYGCAVAHGGGEWGARQKGERDSGKG